MIKAKAYEQGRSVAIPLAASQTVAPGDGLIWASGYLSPAVATTEQVDFVALEAVTTGAGENTPILCLPATGSNILFEADTVANTAAAQRGVAYEMDAVNVIDNATAATANGFVVTELVGAAANKKVLGYFL